MEDTRITADLPNLRIEVLRRELPEEKVEAMTIHLRVAPSFDAVAKAILPALSAASMMNPMAVWLRMAEIAWQPWLRAMGYPALTDRSDDEN